MYIKTLSTLPDANGNPSTSSSISWNGQSFYAYSTITASAWASGSGDLSSITYSGSVGTGCPVTTTTTTTAAPTTTTTTTTIAPNPNCHDITWDNASGLDTSRYGIAYADENGTFQTSSFAGLGFSSVNGTLETWNVCADNVANDVWDTQISAYVPQYNQYLTVTNTLNPCTNSFDCAPGGGF
jgi:hypothetical protein